MTFHGRIAHDAACEILMEQINRKITIGVAWNFVSILLSRGSSTVFTLFLARLLAPEAFGLIAMMTIVIELAQYLVRSGLGQALIRSKVVSDDDLSTIFYTNLGFSLLAYTGLYAGAPLLADFYSQPDLIGLLRVMGLVVFINAMTVVPIAILSRAMDFRSQMIATISGVLLSGVVAVTLAWQGAGVWSLVVQTMVSTSVSALVIWHITPWVPRWVFSTESFRRLFGFGVNLLVTGIIRILVENSQVIAIGRLFGAEVTGLYFFARKLSELISRQISGAVQKATYPAMASLQDDNALLRHKYRQIIQVKMFIIAPIMALLAALAEPLFDVLLGDKWSGAVVYMRLLCIVATLYPLHLMNINVLNVKGRSDLVLKIGLFKNATTLMFLFAAIPYGVFWIVVGQVVNAFVSLIPNTYFTRKLIDYGLKQQLLDIAKPLASAAIAGVAAFFITQAVEWPQLALIVLGSSIGIAMFLLASMVLKVEALQMLWSKKRSLLNITQKNY